jgi:hypothetical protein
MPTATTTPTRDMLDRLQHPPGGYIEHLPGLTAPNRLAVLKV